MSIYFLRHGQTDWNLAGRWQSRSDNRLNATGHEQAEAIVDLLSAQSVQFQAVYSSPMKRAVATATALKPLSQLPVMIEPDLLEVDMGDYEGHCQSDLHERYGASYQQWLDSYHLITAPAGEAFFDAMKRVSNFVAQLTVEATQKHVAVVAHQAVTMAMKAELSQQFSAAQLKSYKQSNQQVDVWDAAARAFVVRLEVTV